MAKQTKEKANQKNMLIQVIMMIAFMAVGAVLGVLAGKYLLAESSPSEASTPDKLVNIVIILIGFYVIMYLEIIIHEAGHLVFGLLTGYKFVSFRVGSFMIQKKQGKYEFKKFKLPGTGGQCLLCPPDVEDGKLPFKLYFLGGVIFNLLTFAIAVPLYLLIPAGPVKLLFLIVAVIGLITAVTNGIPLNTGTIVNDGYNALFLSKDPAARMGLWLQLRANAAQTEGISLKEMPEEWFVLPEDADKKNINYTSALVFFEGRYMDQHDFAAAEDMIDKLLSDEYKMAGIYEGLLKLDKFYIDVYEGKETADLSIFDDNMVKTIIKQMKDVPMTVRSLYAKAILEKDEQAQTKALEHMEKVAKIYPAEGDMKVERALIGLLQEKYAERA